MTKKEARDIIAAWHEARPKDDLLKQDDDGVWALSADGKWAEKRLMPYTYQSAETASAEVRFTKRFPQFGMIFLLAEKEVTQVDSFQKASPKPIRLNGFKDGDYVTLNPPHFPPSEKMLPGGRIEKTETGDWIADIPLAVSWRDCRYHLMSWSVTNPADLRHVKLMSDSQREGWIKEMDRLQAAGEFSKFRSPRPHDRGVPEELKDLF